MNAELTDEELQHLQRQIAGALAHVGMTNARYAMLVIGRGAPRAFVVSNADMDREEVARVFQLAAEMMASGKGIASERTMPIRKPQ